MKRSFRALFYSLIIIVAAGSLAAARYQQSIRRAREHVTPVLGDPVFNPNLNVAGSHLGRKVTFR
jgi:hypothetical protein